MSTCGCDMDSVLYNTYSKIDKFEYKVIEHLFSNEDLWKLIKYNDSDALSPNKPNLTTQEKKDLIWTGQLNSSGDIDSSKYRVFKQSLTDDSFGDMTTHLRVYIGEVVPDNGIIGTVDIYIEILTHSKLNGLMDTELNRISSLLKNVLGTLNGSSIDGVGNLYFNADATRRNKAKHAINNGKNYFGYLIIMSTKTSSTGC